MRRSVSTSSRTSGMATPVRVVIGSIKEPLNKPRAGATEARWDAVLGGGPKQYVDIARADDDEMRPCCSVPSGYGHNARLRRRLACQYRHIGCTRLLASIAFWP